ncbi:hypothetical protein DITRI_Ditri06bG0012300 [Diplodiscus trichospermus]
MGRGLEHEFNYDEGSGRGPSSWGSLKPEWRTCNVGRRQSPINIETPQLHSRLGDFQRNYTFARAVLRNRTEDVAVVWLGNAGSITINGIVYTVVNCHWHSPSEHTFNGTSYPLEIHIVHRSAENWTAVIAILYRYGLPDPFLFRLFGPILTLRLGERQLGLTNPEIIRFPGRRYYGYLGSLTTPPCSEGVIWIVFDQNNMASWTQVAALRNALPRQNRNNSRPTQPLNRRIILLHDPLRTGIFT